MYSPGKNPFFSPLSRRRFLGASASLAAGLSLTGCGRAPQQVTGEGGPVNIVQSGWERSRWNETLNTILAGFIRNALRTSDSFAVCDYSGGTMLKNFVTARGNTCDSVTRIMPEVRLMIRSKRCCQASRKGASGGR